MLRAVPWPWFLIRAPDLTDAPEFSGFERGGDGSGKFRVAEGEPGLERLGGEWRDVREERFIGHFSEDQTQGESRDAQFRRAVQRIAKHAREVGVGDDVRRYGIHRTGEVFGAQREKDE